MSPAPHCEARKWCAERDRRPAGAAAIGMEPGWWRQMANRNWDGVCRTIEEELASNRARRCCAGGERSSSSSSGSSSSSSAPWRGPAERPARCGRIFPPPASRSSRSQSRCAPKMAKSERARPLPLARPSPSALPPQAAPSTDPPPHGRGDAARDEARAWTRRSSDDEALALPIKYRAPRTKHRRISLYCDGVCVCGGGKK